VQDGWLWNDGVVWMHNGEEFWSGYLLWLWPYDFPAGVYTFTLVATNSGGVSASKDFTFRVIDDESDLPDDWSREDIVIALKTGFTISLDRLDAPITRGQFARLMAIMVHDRVPQETHPSTDLDADTLKDGGVGRDGYFIRLMVATGLMDAPDGYFRPHMSLTEREALDIMFRFLVLEDPELGDYDLTEAEYLNGFRLMGIFDDSGPNALKGTDKLTCKLALVRMSRMFQFYYEIP